MFKHTRPGVPVAKFEPKPLPDLPRLSFEDALDALEGLDRKPRQCGGGNWYARCPMPWHDDKRPSFGIREGDDGELLAYCHGAECSSMQRSEFFETFLGVVRGDNVDLPRFSHVDRAELRRRRESRPHDRWKEVRSYPYLDPDTGQQFWRTRYQVTDGETGEVRRELRWNPTGTSPLDAPLYMLKELKESLAADPNRVVALCEGESDVECLVGIGEPATCAPNGSGPWIDRWTGTLRSLGVTAVAVMIDNDEAGRRRGEDIRANLGAAGLSVEVWHSPHANDVRAHVEAGHGQDQMVKVNPSTVANAVNTGEAWEELAPLDTAPTLPPFPVDVLPDPIRGMVVAVAAATLTPPDLAAMVALGVMSTALGGKVSVQIRRNWTEPAHLYLAVGMPPGTRKSAVFSILSNPIHDIEQDLVDTTAIERAEAANELRLAKKRYDNGIAAASRVNTEKTKKTDASDDNKNAVDTDALAKQVQAAEARQIPCPRLLCDDTTPEVLAPILADHGHVGLLSAEGGSIHTATGKRYSDHANVDLLLKAHAGEPYRVDRRSAEAIDIRRAALTIAVAAQPSVLADLAADFELRNRGLLARFLVCLPPDPVGARAFDAPDIADELSAAWAGLIGETARYFYAAKPITVAMSDNAVAVLAALHDRIEPRLTSRGDLFDARDWAGKAVGTAARIAAIVAIFGAVPGSNLTVDQHHVEAGAAIVECLAEHFCYLLDGAGLSPQLTDARAVWTRIVRNGYGPLVTVRELKRSLTYMSDDRLHAALNILVDRGYLRPVDSAPRPGRPSEQYHVRPRG